MISLKKSQSEIIGFVMIVVIVSILAVFFLGYYIRQPSKTLESKEITNFLSSMLRYTTNCSISYEPKYLDVSGLIKRCYINENEICLSGERVCESLKNILSGIMEKSWERYQLDIYYENGHKEKIFNLNSANCTSFIGAKEYIDEGTGSIVVSLKVC